MSASVQWVDFKKAKDSADLVSILNAMGLKVSIRGDEVRSDCPLCGKTKCFSANIERKLWKCFACGESGDVLKLVAQKENVPVREAAARFAPSESRSSGYIKALDPWLEALLPLKPGEDAEAWKKRLRKEIKAKCIESYRNGQAGK